MLLQVCCVPRDEKALFNGKRGVMCSSHGEDKKQDVEDCSCQGCGSDCSCEGDCSDDCSCAQDSGEMQVSFANYLMSMAYQAMIFLGELPNPVTGQTQRNIRQGKFLIDTLAMIQEKTRGNLSQEEESFLSTSLNELGTKYLEAVEKENSEKNQGDSHDR